MKKLTLGKGLLALLLVFLLALTACGSGEEKDKVGLDRFDQKGPEGEVSEGSTLNFGLVSDTAFEGTLNFNFYSGAPDGEVLGWFDEPLLYSDENFQYIQDGPASFEYTDDYKEWTFTIRDDINWHDGEPVTAEDWLLSYEVIGHPD